MNKEEWLKKGYVTEPVDKTLDLKTEIDKLRKEKNALILGHYYQSGEIQDIADFVGDSLALAQWAAKTDADIIVMCGVHFMGETAKILCPDKKVLVPDLNAGCSLADSCPADEFAKFVQEHPDYTVISYVNTTAAVKAVTDVVVTSTNAKQIVESFPADEKIIFGPDRNLGNYINSITGRNMLLWDDCFMCIRNDGTFFKRNITSLFGFHGHGGLGFVDDVSGEYGQFDGDCLGI